MSVPHSNYGGHRKVGLLPAIGGHQGFALCHTVEGEGGAITSLGVISEDATRTRSHTHRERERYSLPRYSRVDGRHNSRRTMWSEMGWGRGPHLGSILIWDRLGVVQVRRPSPITWTAHRLSDFKGAPPQHWPSLSIALVFNHFCDGMWTSTGPCDSTLSCGAGAFSCLMRAALFTQSSQPLLASSTWQSGCWRPVREAGYMHCINVHTLRSTPPPPPLPSETAHPWTTWTPLIQTQTDTDTRCMPTQISTIAR